MFKRKSSIEALWLKYRDKDQYRKYKWELKNYTEQEVLNFFTGADRLDTQEKIIAAAKQDKLLNITHSGNVGDIIYALPTIKKIHEVTGVPVNLYLRLDRPLPAPIFSNTSHSMGAVMINAKTAGKLITLLDTQDYINKTEAYSDQKIHIDLDFFRSRILPLNNANIARWCSYITGVTPELWKPWLLTQPDTSFSDKIVLSRSERYRNSTIDYSFLKDYKNVVFIGVKSEYEDMKKSIPDLELFHTESFLEMAQIIAGCKFFIGNQSFPYSLAEGLKTPRILEAYYHVPHVIPEGENAHDFYFQHHFESLVSRLDKGDTVK
ncbi:hypothetical protein [Mucilaginibacter sp.]|uniref:hypothetical protein n=1 Tax=Mucilaginibacter sp. TaxID=1882438 RepID=UPI0025DCBC56|nr:hypothetical protein [Mucilaginibacter sp.]